MPRWPRNQSRASARPDGLGSGASTAADSLMARHGVHLALERQDDYSQMVAEQALFAGEVANGVAKPAKGAAWANTAMLEP